MLAATRRYSAMLLRIAKVDYIPHAINDYVFVRAATVRVPPAFKRLLT